MKWLIPLTAGILALVPTDRQSMEERIRSGDGTRRAADRASWISLGSLGVIGGGIALRGMVSGDPQAKETSAVAFRSLAATMLTTEAINLATLRADPRSASSGQFFAAGPLESSMVSRPSAVAWSVAAVIGEEYPGWLTRAGVYGLATTVSLSRIVGARSFPSGALLGTIVGYGIGRGLYRRHHRRHGVTDFSAPVESAPDQPLQEGEAGPADRVWVPLDSWMYPALEKLASIGLVPSQHSGLRPWTRGECLRQTREAESLIATEGAGLPEGSHDAAQRLIAALLRELAERGNHNGVYVESLYFRQGGIGGSALTDGYHFGQTWTNDFGRPFGEGSQTLGGVSVRAGSGRFFGYYRGEYQHAPAIAALPAVAVRFAEGIDGVPLAEAGAQPGTNRFRALETYVGIRAGVFQLTAGKSALLWGPTHDAPLSFSANAEPTRNARISLAEPIRLPGILRYLGEIRGEFAIGKLGGHRYTWRPWFNAQKVSFKLTDNLEMGFTRWSIFWGEGHPITLRSFARNFFSASSQLTGGIVDRNDPGDRKGGFDFRYRLPGLRNHVTLYSDSYSDDDPSPLAAPRRAAILPGILFTRIPGIPKLDIRVESPNTTPMAGSRGPGFVYFNNQYRSGNTNERFLLGNSAGRSSRAIQGCLRYWFGPESTIEATYRHRKADSIAFDGGGTQNTASVRAEFRLRSDIRASLFVHHERWVLPVLADAATGRQGDGRSVGAWVQLSYTPNWSIRF